MAGFYLDNIGAERLYVDSSSIKEYLLYDRFSEISEDITSIANICEKLEYTVESISKEDLVDGILSYVEDNNLADLSALLLLNKKHLLALSFALYTGIASYSDILNVINATNYYKRNEILLTILARDNSVDAKINIFGALKTNLKRTVRKTPSNPFPITKKSAKNIAKDKDSGIPMKQIRIPYGAGLIPRENALDLPRYSYILGRRMVWEWFYRTGQILPTSGDYWSKFLGMV